MFRVTRGKVTSPIVTSSFQKAMTSVGLETNIWVRHRILFPMVNPQMYLQKQILILKQSQHNSGKPLFMQVDSLKVPPTSTTHFVHSLNRANGVSFMCQTQFWTQAMACLIPDWTSATYMYASICRCTCRSSCVEFHFL